MIALLQNLLFWKQICEENFWNSLIFNLICYSLWVKLYDFNAYLSGTVQDTRFL